MMRARRRLVTGIFAIMLAIEATALTLRMIPLDDPLFAACHLAALVILGAALYLIQHYRYRDIRGAHR